MKKITIILLLIALITVNTACSNNVTLDLDKAKTNVENLRNNEFYFEGIVGYIENNSLINLGTTDELYSDEFTEELGFDPSNLENYLVKINQQTKDMYIILLPSEGKKEEVKKQMKTYFNKLEKNDEIKEKVKNRLEQTYSNYLVYIVSDDNEEIFRTIKNSRSSFFSNVIELTEEEIKTTLNINPEDLEEYVALVPLLIVHSNTYFILKPKKDKKETVKNAMTEYMKNLENQWEMYLQDQYQLVKNRLEKEYGDYLIYIVSKDNEKVFKTIKESKQK